MYRSPRARTARRFAVIATAIAAASVVAVPPAAAHVEVEAKGARALDQNVTLSFNAESESADAGITKLEVILPQGLSPRDITYKDGPRNWKFVRSERGYAVSGPAVPAGKDAAYSVTVRQLPDVESLAFKTLQSYEGGRTDRWIELEKPGEHDHADAGGHGNQAPTLELKPAAADATPLSPSPSESKTSAAPSGSSTTAEGSTGAEQAEEKDDGSSPAIPLISGRAPVPPAAVSP
ncbi:DUF1775 domain-containing protein [Streptomyces ochraceiscleroticus]|uniref:DUF1775 domain-containing protein n=1 Tax=Streptomyces ochraceiscleroticus TaxID=47761 RepID=UPI0004C8D243|nr:DUF1775 domain-containing protein [Streptomyces ochraceiscleroticus]